MKTKPNEIPLKQWVYEQADKDNVSDRAIWQRIARGKYPHLRLRRVNKRVIFVVCWRIEP